MLQSNSYFNGKVMSIAFQTDTLPATVGVMEPGEYRFNTAKKETMTVISGALFIRLTEDAEEELYSAGQTFHVAANSTFNVRVTEETAYLCLYG